MDVKNILGVIVGITLVTTPGVMTLISNVEAVTVQTYEQTRGPAKYLLLSQVRMSM